MYKLYKVTNQINKKIYVGITELLIEQRWKQHLTDAKYPEYPLHRAIKKHRYENFIIELLLDSKDRDYISSLEEPTIQLLESHISKNGYNIAKGGYGGDLGPAANKKRQNTILNFSKEKKEDISKKLSESHIGLRRTEAEKENISRLQKQRGGYGPIKQTAETRNKISMGNIGKVRSELSKQNYSRIAKVRGTGPQLQRKRISCMCCQRSWDLGNYTQHLNRKNKNELQ